MIYAALGKGRGKGKGKGQGLAALPAPGGGGSGGPAPVEARTVFFSGADFATPSSELMAHFEQVGDISKFQLFTVPDGRSRGMGFCEYTKKFMAEEAIAQLDGHIVDGRSLV